jgi:hypothetical protein
MPGLRERLRVALSGFDLAVGAQRRLKRGARALWDLQPVAQDTLPVGCDQDSHSATGTLEPAGQEPPSRARELTREPADRIRRRVERVSRQKLELHTRAKRTTGQQQPQHGHSDSDEQGTTGKR